MHAVLALSVVTQSERLRAELAEVRRVLGAEEVRWEGVLREAAARAAEREGAAARDAAARLQRAREEIEDLRARQTMQLQQLRAQVGVNSKVARGAYMRARRRGLEEQE